MDSLIGVVPDGWAELRLHEICDILAGPPAAKVSSARRGPADVPVVMPKDLRHNRVADDCGTRVPEEVARELSRYRLLPGDVVSARTGHVGRSALVGANQRGWLIGSSCLRLRVHQPIRAGYLVHYLGHPVVRDWIVRNSGGSAVPSLSAKTLGSLPVVVPSVSVQTGIADVLGALDDKIIVHEQISLTTAALRDAALLQLLTGKDTATLSGSVVT